MEINIEFREKVHYIAVTCIIQKKGKFLIVKRSPTEKAFPDKWCVPGGKLELKDFVNSPKDTSAHWLGVFEKVVQREVKEETALEIKNINYVSNLAFMRPNGFSTIVVSLSAEWASGEVVLNKEELVEHAWVSLEEAKQYDLIENIFEQIKAVERRKEI
ncbi:MAG: NUDIX domain-containing protein [Candidatus Woesearchaeota archaeon]|nr:NUDIX domain-containing protein [Candidatus Woesearchaeota archaeon]